VRRALPAICALAAALLAPPPASAYWTARRAATARATVATLPPPVLSATVVTKSARLSWTAVKPPTGEAEALYYVTRNGGEPSGGCPSRTAPAKVLECTDSPKAKGSYTYKVTALWRSWTALSNEQTVAL
jgi:hypothetical protein